MASGNVNDVLDQVRALLSRNDPQAAMEVLSPHMRSRSKLIINAYGVCLMRMGRNEEAMELLRELVFQGNSFALSTDVPSVVKTNFATALLLTHNVDGAQSVLNQLDETKDEAVARLKAAIAKWKKSLSLFERLQCLWGTPEKRVVLDYPPGEV